MLALLAFQLLLGLQPVVSASYPPGPWNISDYCNAPHVNASHYEHPTEDAELVHLSVLMRHHKRAPVALVPDERSINVGIGWDCTCAKQFTYGGGGARLYHTVRTPPNHPFAQQIWPGTCEEGQLTAGGFNDAREHGKDFWGLYHDHLDFLHAVEPTEINVRTTYIDRTKQVASAMLAGMEPLTAERDWASHSQPQRIDSLVPNYKCPRADALQAAAQAAPKWQAILKKNEALKARLDAVLGTKDSKAVWPNSFMFYQDVLTSRVCNDHPLPCNTAGDCVSEEDAAQIFELGNIEFDYLWHTANNATESNQLTFGAMFSELADGLESPRHRLMLYVAHDLSVVRLASGLEIFPIHWPKLGSEIVIEIWKDKHDERFVRVLYDGAVVRHLGWTPLERFLQHLRRQVPKDLFEKCTAVPSKEALMLQTTVQHSALQSPDTFPIQAPLL
ncbi:phosphoglycerate mutase-like protein [Gloeopeniophorella convolvens]|nr:phosphoglycerate mutase-like protein [Gloeopeniophorella convolvens]